LRPATEKRSNVRLVKKRPEVFARQVQGCVETFAEMKEVKQHFKQAYAKHHEMPEVEGRKHPASWTDTCGLAYHKQINKNLNADF